ncbi:prolyl oligopeptidase Serine peptidase. MEROPS family S09A [Fontimonas thermophila]|uniref:prolyl oligopeptidase n=1 Tax=Fontimonas thermophila TaxID=1076937 RepID=A0A1I2JPC6_9GAMM|nr:prolyl oligopeptidase family serine peptidase [Fontimonas thermophila]SFF56805.1 prolyl oligopeptidase Serine peptidase. MEROPS family S09A [Fontimonas thermophila]
MIRAFVCFLVAVTAAPTAHALDYPDTPRGPVVDDYFGTPVPDPYRWLEDVDSPQTRAWVEAQNALSLPFLARLPEREALRRRLTELWNFERYEVVEKRAGRYFFRRNDGLQNQSVLYVQDGRKARPRALLDPNLLAADGSVALTDYEVSPDGRWLAYATATSGSDWNEIRVRDIATGKDGPDHLVRIKFSSIAWTRDAKGFFYSRYPDPPEGAAAGTFDDLAHQKLYYHRVGTPQSEDLLIFETPQEPKWGFVPEVTDDGRWLVITIWRGSENAYRVYVKDLGDPQRPRLDAPVIKLVDDFEAEYALIGNVGSVLYFRTSQGVERGRIAAVDLADPDRTWRSIVPEQADTLRHALFAGDGIVALYMRDATSRLRRFALDGTPRGEIALPGLGSVPDLNFGGVQIRGQFGDPELFYAFASFNRPATNYVYDLSKNRGAVFHPLKLRFNPDDYVTEQVFYPSKDGTKIPMFISYKRGLKRDGQNPTHLYGYGGFDIPLTPTFSVPNLVWMERGGIFAQANLRGGGEYGRAWHEAGTRERKQNVFDDFAAAAQYLIAQQYTSPRHLAISGRSNGGLLVGATLNQHPELFAAALPAVGVMDMLRYHRFTIGWAWASDYGTAETEEGFKYLYAYSPLHTIKPGTRYPAVLVTTADHDDRVVPGHSYKYTAALQHAQAGDAPILIRIDIKAGHGAGKPIGKLIEEEADKLAFMRYYTGGHSAPARH